MAEAGTGAVEASSSYKVAGEVAGIAEGDLVEVVERLLEVAAAPWVAVEGAYLQLLAAASWRRD